MMFIKKFADVGQRTLSVRWVINEKTLYDKNASKHTWSLEGTRSKKSI